MFATTYEPQTTAAGHANLGCAGAFNKVNAVQQDSLSMNQTHSPTERLVSSEQSSHEGVCSSPVCPSVQQGGTAHVHTVPSS